jgi:acyl-CoA dehydrogenase
MYPIEAYGSEAQKQKYLPKLASGEWVGCFGLTEPDAGSDPGGMRTTAVKDGNHYVVNGVKRFITGASKADFCQLLAATDRGKGSRGGISMLLVDMDTPGVKLGAQYETMMGDKPWEIVFDNVRVPASNLVGAEGQGMAFGQEWLNIGRVKHGAHALGVAERCLEMSSSYAKQRSTFGQPLSSRQGVQWMLADMYVELQLARLMVYKTAWRLDRGEEAREDAYVLRRRNGVPHCRQMHADPRRHCADHRHGDREAVATAAQLPHHRGRDRSDEDGDRPPRAENLRIISTHVLRRARRQARVEHSMKRDSGRPSAGLE